MIFDFFNNFKHNYYRMRGQKLLFSGEPEKAYHYLEKALLCDDNETNIYFFSLALITLGRLDEAEKYLSNLVGNYPDNELATLSLSELFVQKRKWDQAIVLFEKLVEKHPSNNNYRQYLQRIVDPNARENYIKAKEMLNESLLLLNQKQTDQALNKLLAAAKIDPDNPYIQNNLGSIYMLIKKDKKKAMEHFHKAYQADPNNLKFKKNLEAARRQQ